MSLATPGAELTEYESDRLASVERWEVPAPFDRTRSRASSDISAEVRAPEGHQGGVHRVRQWAANALDASFPVDTWAPLFYAARSKMVAKATRWRPDIIWSTADPWSGQGLAYHLSRRLRVPWVSDLRDPWTLCPKRSAMRSGFGRFWDRRAERRWLNAAARIGFTSRVTQARYAQAYPALAARMFTEPNSFEPASGWEVGLEQSRERDSGPLDVLFFGRFRPTAPARVLVEAVAKAVQRDAQHGREIRVRSIGGLTGDDLSLAESLGVASAFVSTEPVAYENALAALRNADILVMSSSQDRPEVIPAKCWDYLPAGRPILSLCGNAEIEEILSRTASGLQVDPRREDASEVLAERLLNARIHKIAGEPLVDGVSPIAEHIECYGAPRSTERLIEQLEMALHSRGQG